MRKRTKYGVTKEKNKYANSKSYGAKEKKMESWGFRQYLTADNFEKVCGFRLCDLKSFDRLTTLLYQPRNPASLGIVRALFGLCMVLDVVEERGFAGVDLKWGDPMECHFPLIHGMKPPTLPWMIIIYTIMWTGAFGIMLGFRFKLSCALFALPYWYIFLLDKSYWNNHTYLYGIVAILLSTTGADKYFGLDAKLYTENDRTVPLWNYFILRFQFFALYFLAGLKKSGREWLEGYAMTNLSKHWVFSPFRFLLTSEQTDLLIVHWFGFIFDLTVGFWMLFEKTRIPAMIFCTTFHLMNSRLFSIGMFPYVCLATMPLFCNADWPCKTVSYFKVAYRSIFCIQNKNIDINEASSGGIPQTKDRNNSSEQLLNKLNATHYPDCHGLNIADSKHFSKKKCLEINRNGGLNNRGTQSEGRKFDLAYKSFKEIHRPKVTTKQKVVVLLLLFHIFLQFFLPYSHFITKGYNNWVPGLYGYSWDMMVHTWETILVVIKVHDNVNNEDHYLDPKAWVQSDRWEKHGDMARQYAFCIKENLMKQRSIAISTDLVSAYGSNEISLSSNLSIYIDVWCSLNGRFQQRIFNPNIDLLTVDWHPLKPISFLMPLLSQYNSYRYKLDEIQEDVYTWSNNTDVLFVADFPGMHLDNYISGNFTNVSLTVLEGEVTYVDENRTITLTRKSSIPIRTKTFHKVQTTSAYPACYMYTYNSPSINLSSIDRSATEEISKDELAISREIRYKFEAWLETVTHIANAFFYFVYDVPMIRRIPGDK